MLTSTTHQQSLVDAGSETRPPMLEREPKMQTEDDLRGEELLYYEAEIEAMDLILISIPNEIYNSWMLALCPKTCGKELNFVAAPGEELVSVYNRFAQLMNDLERNKMNFLLAYTGSSSRNTSSYYVTHPSSVVDYDDEYQKGVVQSNSEDPLTSVMLLLARAITQNFSTLTNNRLRTSSNTINQAIIQGDRTETRNVQRTLRTSSPGNTINVQCYNCSEKGHYARNCPKPRVRDSKYFMEQMMEEIEELSANICLMAMIQPANTTSDDGSSYDSALERVRVLENIKENKNYYNEFIEADRKAKRFDQQAQSQFVRDRDIIRGLEKQRDKLDLVVNDYKRKNEELQKTHSILKIQMSENEDSYHDTVLDLEAKLKKNVDIMMKLSNSLQGMFMLGPKPLSVYDPRLKHGLGYLNPYTLKQAISKCLKLYLASSLNNLEIPLDVRDTEEIIDDASKNQVKPIVKELHIYFEAFKNNFQSDIKEMKDVFDTTESDLCEIKKQNEFLKDQLLEAIIKHEVEISVLIGHECVDNSLHAKIEQIQRNSIEIQEGMQARIKVLEKDVQRCQKQSIDFELKLQHKKEKRKWESSLKKDNANFLGRQSLDYSWISKLEKLENENVSLDFTVQSLIKELDNVKLEYQKLFDSIKKTRSQTQKEMDELIDYVSQKTYAYADIRAENQNLLITIFELKNRLRNVEKGKSVNTKFDKTNVSQNLLCVTPINKQVFQKKNVVSKIEEKHVVSKPITLQTSPNKQRGINSNNNVIAPGMYRVVTKQESQTKETKSVLSSTGMNAASSVRRPMNKDSNVKKSVLANSKISAKKNVIDVDVENASKAKVVLCVSCMKNVLIPCHDKCLANYKLNVHSNVRRALFTNPRTPKSLDTTHEVSKTRFSKKLAQSKSLDNTPIVSKTKIDVGSVSKAKNKVIQIVLWIVDSGCSKHMTGDRSLLRNFIKKFMGTVRFGNDNFAAITSYGDYIQGNITICHVYYVEGLGHNLFSVGKFYDGDLEVAFRFKTCYVRNLEGDDLLTGDRESNLYTISIFDMAASSPVCLMSKATLTKSWLWHRRLSHLNFGTINNLTRLDLVDGLPKFKYGKDHLCSTCERGKSKKASHPPKLVPNDHSKLELLHMDLCWPMRVASTNGKKYILVIVDDYSRYTWVYFLHSKTKLQKS
ncbi:integrase, catalytic region, zinc finger, CCHC-type containing protein [Tanacetum coccineum]